MTKQQQGRILTSLGGFYEVALPSGERLECRAKGKFRKDQQKPLVGDLVTVEENEQGLSMVSAILPRKNQLIRPPLANLDQLVAGDQFGRSRSQPVGAGSAHRRGRAPIHRSGNRLYQSRPSRSGTHLFGVPKGRLSHLCCAARTSRILPSPFGKC